MCLIVNEQFLKIQIKKNYSPLGFTFAKFSGSFSSTRSSAAATKIKKSLSCLL